jgi:hypothetical protein
VRGAAVPREAAAAAPARHLTAQSESTAEPDRRQTERVAGAVERECAAVRITGADPSTNLARRRTVRLTPEGLERIDQKYGEESDVPGTLGLALAGLGLRHARSDPKNRTIGGTTPRERRHTT